MSSSISGLFDLLSSKMNYLNQKQAVLAENVANADTPDFKQLELKPFTFGEALRQTDVGMRVTDPRHIVPASMAGANARTLRSKDVEISPSGNSVDVEGQMLEESKTVGDFQLMTSIYHKMAGLVKISVKGSSGG